MLPRTSGTQLGLHGKDGAARARRSDGGSKRTHHLGFNCDTVSEENRDLNRSSNRTGVERDTGGHEEPTG